ASRASIALDTVYHVVATYDGTSMNIFINGVLDARKSVIGTLVYGDATSGLGVGGTFTPGYQPAFSGVLDEVAIYDTALHAPEALQHYRVGSDATADIRWRH